MGISGRFCQEKNVKTFRFICFIRALFVATIFSFEVFPA